MRHLTDDIVLSVKDAVRNLRYAIRSEARSPIMVWPGDPKAKHAYARSSSRGRRRSRVAKLVDSVFTEVESGALSLVSPKRDIGHDVVFPRPVTAYFGHGHPSRDEAAERLFARTHYHAVKALLSGFELRNMLIFEHAIGRARDSVLRRHGDLVHRVSDASAAAMTEEVRTDRVRLCAALTCGLVEARPIKEVDFASHAASPPRGLVTSPNVYCFTVTGLATAIASVQDPAALLQAAEIDESVTAVVDVRFGRFAAALEAEEPVEALAQEFNEVLPFLP